MNKYITYYEQLPWHDPEQVFLNLFADKKFTFWLDSPQTSDISNQTSTIKHPFSYMGVAAKIIKYTLSKHTLCITNNNNPPVEEQILGQNIFTYLKKELSNTAPNNLPFDFTGGFIGCFGYEIINSHFFFIDKFLAFDHQKKIIYLVCISKQKDEANQWFSSITNSLTKSQITNNHVTMKQCSHPRSLTFTLARNREQYLLDIQTCQKYLNQGDAYQICLTNQISTNTKLNSLDLYLNLRQTNPAPFNAYLNFSDFALLSSSPEQFLHIDKNRCVVSKPMKGTRPRGHNSTEDKQIAGKLGKTPKDYAENIMIVDLIRNDLGKVCKIGSIRVVKPLTVESYINVHQLVSTIKGKLKNNLTAIDAIESSFPGGSMTGAPKIRAMQILSQIEKTPRGIYSGAFGYLSLNGTANLAMTIRTIIATPNQLSFGSGGAILTDSMPVDEYQEMLLKTQTLISAIIKTTGAKEYKII